MTRLAGYGRPSPSSSGSGSIGPGRSVTWVFPSSSVTVSTIQLSPLRLRTSPTLGALALMRNCLSPEGYRMVCSAEDIASLFPPHLAHWLRFGTRREEELCRYAHRRYHVRGKLKTSGPAHLLVHRLGDTPLPWPIPDVPATELEINTVMDDVMIDVQRADLVAVVGPTFTPHKRPRDQHPVTPSVVGSGGGPHSSDASSLDCSDALFPLEDPVEWRVSSGVRSRQLLYDRRRDRLNTVTHGAERAVS